MNDTFTREQLEQLATDLRNRSQLNWECAKAEKVSALRSAELKGESTGLAMAADVLIHRMRYEW